eukprot:Skav220683  [mRNA]  locus=scaffold4902:39183:40898:- [translate_table: standard]
MGVPYRRSSQETLAPEILRHGVRSLNDLTLKVDDLIQAGVASWRVEAVLAASHKPVQPVHSAGRADLPVPFQGKRANLAAALEAALPNQRQRSLELLDQDILARSTNPSQEARIRTYQAICAAWELQPWPLCHANLRAFAASLKAGGYRSASVYFQAVCSHQQRHLHTPVDQMLRHTIRDCLRSILRGLGAHRLKDSFNGLKLAEVPISHDETAFDMEDLSHARDMAVIGLWYMLRESEMASAKLSHLSLDSMEVRLKIPIHKTDCFGGLCERTLSCSCRMRQHSLCVWHAAERHLIRCQAHTTLTDATRFPLFPTRSGGVGTKHQFITAIRAVIGATGTPLEREDPNGKLVPRFHGHVLRVSGAQLLFTAGVHLQLIQLLGRWTSMTILRYTQQAGLNLLPGIPDIVLNNSSDLSAFAIAPAVPSQSGHGAPEQNVRPRKSQAASSEAPPRSAPVESVDPAALQALRDELTQLKQLVSVKDVRAVYVIRTRSHIVHLGSSHELSNPPKSWRTRCGWGYGSSNFLRICEINSPLRRCKKCFDIDGSSDSEAQESQSGFSDLQLSDASEESE